MECVLEKAKITTTEFEEIENISSSLDCQKECQNVQKCLSWSYGPQCLIMEMDINFNNIANDEEWTSGPRYCPCEYFNIFKS